MIIFQDEHFFAIDKPPGHFVHPPEFTRYPVPRERVALFTLQAHFGRPVYPVHRLDAPTSGLVLFAFTKDATRCLSQLFKEREIRKTYHAVARGFLDDEGRIDLPLKIKGFGELNECVTTYRTLARVELPFAVGTKYKSARYSLVEVSPLTGRWHQIRRHFDQIAHPLLGDIEHGDSHHNRFFRDELGIRGLCLRAVHLSFVHPWSGVAIEIAAPKSAQWRKINAVFEQGGLESKGAQSSSQDLRC